MKIHYQRDAALVRRRKVEVKLASPTEEVLQGIMQGKMSVSVADMRWVAHTVLKSWVLLGCFALSQSRYLGFAE